MNKGCPKCGRTVEYSSQKCPYCNFDFSLINTINRKKYNNNQKYAGFIKRLIAGIIDIYIVLLITFFILMVINKQLTKENIGLIIIVFISVYIPYNSILERTKMHGSIGKQIVKIETTDEYENPITLPKAIVRNISKIFNIITLGIGFITCSIQEQKQTLGDRISKTYVINKIDLKEENQLNIANIYTRLLAFIIDVIYIIIIIFAIDYVIKTIKPADVDLEIITIALSLTIILTYFPYNESKKGRTRGKKIFNLKVVNYDEEKILFIHSLIREILIIVDLLTLGFLLPLVNQNGQTLKDTITKTIVIEE